MTRPQSFQELDEALVRVVEAEEKGWIAQLKASGLDPLTDLAGIVLDNTDLQGVDFRNADLRGASFRCTLLSGTDFRGANLEKASFRGALIYGARFDGANLHKTDFQGVLHDQERVGSRIRGVFGVYRNQATAYKVVDYLEGRGFGKDHLRIISKEQGNRSDYKVELKEIDLPKVLARYRVPNSEAKFYSEIIDQGNALVIVRVHDLDAEVAVDVLKKYKPVLHDDRDYGTRQAGIYTEEQMVKERERYAEQAKARLREIQEQRKIGKRDYIKNIGVHKYVDTDVIEETLHLREDSIELVERAEEAVVEKEARVTGKVAVGKEARVREEAVGGKVRSTRVEVEETAGRGAVASGVTWVDIEPKLREHYTTAYASTDYDYDRYEPAYRYGYDMATDNRYRDHDFNAVEAELRRRYVERHDESLWEETKDAVRQAYNSVRRSY